MVSVRHHTKVVDLKSVESGKKFGRRIAPHAYILTRISKRRHDAAQVGALICDDGDILETILKLADG